MSEYTKQADKFLSRHSLRFTARKIGHGPYFHDDKESRDIYRLGLRGVGGGYQARKTWFKFGASLNNTASNTAPTAYDLLAGITKYDPGTFEEFCRELGYDSDSRKAERVYKGCVSEWAKVTRFFTAEEIEELKEIN